MEILPQVFLSIGVVQAIRKSLETPKRLPEWDKNVLSKIWIGAFVYFGVAQVPGLHFLGHYFGLVICLLLLATMYQLRDYPPARLYAIALLPYTAFFILNNTLKGLMPTIYDEYLGQYLDPAASFTDLWMIGFGIYAFTQNRREQKQRRKEEEKLRIAEARKAELEVLVSERTAELTAQKNTLEKALDDLKAAQTQLVHAEKMASLGELTAGIAHEIQNPLNFVNNFSELSVELARELREEMEKPEPDQGLVQDLLQDLAQNQEKINHHGKRASGIVTAMLQHARTGSGKKEPAELNTLADEYLRLAYHGLRAKDKSFNAKMTTDLDPAVGTINIVAQDIGRVLLNLINNAFFAVSEKARQTPPPPGYEPTVSVSTKRLPAGVEIRVRDNGAGIPDHVKSKIFQPFFTTKPTGQGTGLGLSLAFDIVTKGHGGTIQVQSEEGQGTEFVIFLPD